MTYIIIDELVDSKTLDAAAKARIKGGAISKDGLSPGSLSGESPGYVPMEPELPSLDKDALRQSVLESLPEWIRDYDVPHIPTPV